MIVRTSIRDPATNASVSRQSITHTMRGTGAACTSKKRKTRNVSSDAMTTPRTAPHMSRVDTYRHQRL